MLLGMCLGTNDLARAGRFYDAVLAVVGLNRSFENEREIGYGPAGGDRCLWILKPFDGRPATWGNGTQLSFHAASREAVDRFYRAALAQGGMDEGAPGPRGYRPGYYGAYCRDLDGNMLHVWHEDG
jgi:catechol 2,3-dioxygenase-like lactoylglutathione lyase family enzyme